MMPNPSMIPSIWWIAPAPAATALGFAVYFDRKMLKADPGSPAMVEIAGHIREGSMAYLTRQYKVVALVFGIIAVLLVGRAYCGSQHPLIPFAFLTGGF